MFFNQYPYINMNDLNLDFLLKTIGEIKDEVENFVSINALKYADPIQWNITTQYEKNTIVIDPQSGTAYISVQPVPSGVALTNTNYWTVVFDLEQFVTKANNNFTVRVEPLTTLNATFPTPINGWLVWQGILYKALTNIIAGDQYVENSNIKKITVEEIVGHLEDLDTTNKTNLVNAINEVIANINTEVLDRIAADATLQNNIDAEATARTNADATLQNNIDNAEATLQNNIDAEATARTNADATLQNNIDAEATARQTVDGNLQNLTTTDKTNLVSAINEVNAKDVTVDYTGLSHRKIMILADSYGNHTNADGEYFDNIISRLSGAYCERIARSGGACYNNTLLASLMEYAGDTSVFDTLIYIGGANDLSVVFTHEAEMIAGVNALIAGIRTKFPNVKNIYFLSCGLTFNSTYLNSMRNKLVEIYKGGCLNNRAVYIDNSQYILRNTSLLENDLCHPNAAGVDVIARFAIEGMIKGCVDVHYTLDVTSTTSPSVLHMVRNNGTVQIYSAGAIKYLAKFSGPIDNNYNILATLNGSLVQSYDANGMGLVNMIGFGYSGTTPVTIMLALTITDNTIRAYSLSTPADGTLSATDVEIVGTPIFVD